MKIGRILTSSWKSKLLDLSGNRPALSRDEFTSLLQEKNHSLEVIDRVYDVLVSYLPNVEGFSMYPDDDLLTGYDMDDEDLGDLIQKVLKSFGSQLPPRKEQNTFYEEHGKDVTVERMIQFVERFR